LVSSYGVCDDMIEGSGYPYPKPIFPGRECARWYLLTGIFIFGTPTTVMYRSCLVNRDQDFYDETLTLYADFDKCIQILQHWDLGFVHQVLSFRRTDNESTSSGPNSVQYHAVARYSIVQRYSPIFLEASEGASLQRKSKRAYYRILARRALRFGDAPF